MPSMPNSPETISLRTHFERLLEENTRRTEARLDAMDTAVEVATFNLNRRLMELNELRKEVTTDRLQFLVRDVYESSEKERMTWRENVNARLTAIDTRSVTWTAAIGVFFFIVQLALYF